MLCCVVLHDAGLAAAMGTAAGHLASFVKTHKALRENAGGSDDKVCVVGPHAFNRVARRLEQVTAEYKNSMQDYTVQPQRSSTGGECGEK